MPTTWWTRGCSGGCGGCAWGDVYLAVEHFGNVDSMTALGLPVEQPVDVGHTTHVTHCYNIGVAFRQVTGFALAHGRADASVFDGEEAAKAATFFGPIEGNNFRAGNVG